jgi:hypothetical protein
MKSQHIIWQHVSLRVYMNWWNGSSVAEATLLTDNGGPWDVMLLKSHFDLPKNSWCHTLHCMWDWMHRGQKAPLPKPLWGGCTPGPLVTLCPTLSDFQIYCQIRFIRFSSGHPNNWIFSYLGHPDNQIWQFGWIWMSSDDPNLASFKTKFGERCIGEEWNLAWWGAFVLSPIWGVPKFLWGIPLSYCIMHNLLGVAVKWPKHMRACVFGGKVGWGASVFGNFQFLSLFTFSKISFSNSRIEQMESFWQWPLETVINGAPKSTNITLWVLRP